MPGNIKHESVGTTLTQAEYEVADGGVIQFASQATGDIPYASSATVIEGLAIGSSNQILTVSGGIPAWASNITVPGTLTVTGVATLSAAPLFINDSSNANMTIGITINQAAADDDILTFKSSDIAHGMTTITETDTYGYVRKASGSLGGLTFTGLIETGSARALNFQGIATDDDTTKSTAGTAPVVFNSFKKSGTSIGAVGADGNLVVVQNNSSTRWIVDEDGDTWQNGGAIFNNVVFINDTSNAGMTMGLTINQGGNDDDILAFKSSDVSHPLTGVTEADTYGRIKKVGATTGGLEIAGFTTAGLSSGGVTLLGITGAAADTTDTTSSGAVIELIGRDTNGGSGGDDIGATGNVITVQNNATTLMLVKGNGDIHATNVTAGQLDGTALDAWDDPSLVRVWQSQGGELAGVIKDEWDGIVKYNEDDLKRAGVLGSDGTMFNMTQLLRLFGGAIWQQQKRILSLEQQLTALPRGN